MEDPDHTHRCNSPFRPRNAYGDIDAILLFSINLEKKGTNGLEWNNGIMEFDLFSSAVGPDFTSHVQMLTV